MWRITSRADSFPAVAAALWAVARADGEPSADQRAWLDQLARRHEAADPGPVEPWSVDEVADALTDADERRRLVRHLVLMALLDARVDGAEIEAVESFARGLGVSHPAVATLRTFVRGRTRALARQLFAGSFIASLMKAIWRQEGLPGAWRIAKAVARLRDRAKAARYQALGELPEGTLGRVLHDHCRANGFALPGERRGTPEILLFHDVGHALTGRGADAAGEVGMAGFEAGFMGGDDAYSIALFGLYAFGVGAQILPGVTTRAGDFDVDNFTCAYAEGEALDLDLRFWDPWPSMDRPVNEVRQALGMSEGNCTM